MRAVALAVVSLLAACSREPTFDERYKEAEKQIRETAKEIDAEIGQRDKARSTGTPAAAPSESAPHGSGSGSDNAP